MADIDGAVARHAELGQQLAALEKAQARLVRPVHMPSLVMRHIFLLSHVHVLRRQTVPGVGDGDDDAPIVPWTSVAVAAQIAELTLRRQAVVSELTAVYLELLAHAADDASIGGGGGDSTSTTSSRDGEGSRSGSTTSSGEEEAEGRGAATEKLYPVGYLIYLSPPVANPPSPLPAEPYDAGTAGGHASTGVTAMRVDQTAFERVLLGPAMLVAHLNHSYQEAIEKCGPS
jgi:hypothetical protein